MVGGWWWFVLAGRGSRPAKQHLRCKRLAGRKFLLFKRFGLISDSERERGRQKNRETKERKRERERERSPQEREREHIASALRERA